MSGFFRLTSKKQKKLQKLFSSVAVFSLFLQITSGVFYYQPVIAEDGTETTPVVEQPIETPTVSEATPAPENTATPEPTPSVETRAEVTPTPVVEVTPTPIPAEGSVAGESTTPPQETGPPLDLEKPVEDPVSAQIIPTPTPVEKVCLAEGQEIKDTTNDNWEINLNEDWSQTKESVKLGVKYVFPQENKVSVTFKCLPKEGTAQLKIQKVKISDLKLPEGTNPYGEYAYDITTGMQDGTFEYDVTLPKPENQTAEVSFMESKDSELQTVDEGKLNQEGDKVKAESLDHFTIFIATYSSSTFFTEKSSYAQGETVYVQSTGLTYGDSIYYRIDLTEPDGLTKHNISSCQRRVTSKSGNYILPTNAALGTWQATIQKHDSSSECNSNTDIKDTGVDTFTVTQGSFPDLVVSKTNNVGGNATVGQSFEWTLTVTNNGLANASFNNEDILEDDLPNSGASYSPTSNIPVAVSGGVTGSIDCDISSNTLVCDDNSGGNSVIIPPGGSFSLIINVTPTSTGSLQNPRSGSGNICQVDPDGKETESNEDNNTCSNTVNVASVQPANNPTLGQSCGLDIALVFDGSGSIDDGEYSQMQAAFVNFVNAFLPGTPTEMSIVEFASGSIIRQGFTNNKTTLINEINSSREQPGGMYTNWEQGLISANSLFTNRANPDLIVFASDGNPNRIGNPSNSVSEEEAVTAAVGVANIIKGNDIRIITIGIGNDLDSDNLIAISSADAYFSSNFDQLAATLAQLATNLCGGTISVNKYIDTVSDQTRGGAGWTYHVSGPSSYSNDLTTDTNGQDNTGTISSGSGYSIVETNMLPGYSFGSAVCRNQAGASVGSSISNGVGAISISNQDIISCDFVNTTNAVCGNGEPEEDEECDNGSDNGTACTPSYGGSCNYCSVDCDNVIVTGPYCGDSNINSPYEACDNDSPQACQTTNGYAGTQTCSSCQWDACQTNEYCGDGIVNGLEQCDGIEGVPEHYVCNSSCTEEYVPYCGDGNTDPGEQCDDGNKVNHDSCSTSCKTEYPITFEKKVTGGEAQPNEWSFNVSGYGIVHNGDTVYFIPGYYPITESGPDHYSLGSTGGSCHDSDGNIELAVSDSDPSFCRITNVYEPYCGDGVKNGDEQCDGSDLGDLPSSDFSCNRCQLELINPKVTICHASSSQSNPYNVQEPNKSADVSGHDGHIGPIWYPGITGNWGDIIPPFYYIGGHYDGKNWTTEGQAIYRNDCSFPTGTITFVKDAQPNSSQVFNFTYAPNEYPISGFSLTDDGNGDNSERNVFSAIPAGVYSWSEDAVLGWSLDNIRCSEDKTSNSTKDLATRSVNIVLDPGENVTCTFINKQDTGTLKVKKNVDLNGDGDYDEANETNNGTWKWQYNGGADQNTGASAISVPTGDYVLTETMKTDFHFVDLTCTGGTLTGNTVTVNKGANVVCTFKNAKDTGTIKIIKDAIDNDEENFRFTTNIPGVGGDFNLNDDGYGSNSRTFTLPVGSYWVQEDNESGWKLTDLSCKGDEVSIDGRKVTINLDKGENVECTYTNTQLGKISGYKFNDKNTSGDWEWWDFWLGEYALGNWRIFIDEGNGEYDGTEPSYVTNNWMWYIPFWTGYYEFNNLLPGTYSICEELQSGWTSTSGSLCRTVDLSSGEHEFSVNFGNIQYGSISGTKFEDINGNGQRDDEGGSEPGLSGWTIQLKDMSDNVLDTFVTDSKGDYEFKQLSSGAYKVCEVEQDGWTQTSTPECYEITVNGDDHLYKDFGNFQLGHVQGCKFEDLNNDGLRQSETENQIRDWKIRLYKQGDGSWDFVEERLTGHNGSEDNRYYFDGLTLGTYYVCEENQVGWTQTGPNADNGVANQSPNANVDEAPYCRQINVTTSNQWFYSQQFGNIRLGKVTVCKYDDYDGDGQKDDNEPGINGVNISINHLLKEVADRQISLLNGWSDQGITGDGENPQGCYTFENLLLGDYRVTEEASEVLAGYEPSDGTSTTYDISLTEGGQTQYVDFFNELQPITLGLAKTHNKVGFTVARGEVLTFTLTIENTADSTAYNVNVRDVLPLGFGYVTGTAKVDGSLSEPAISGQQLTWNVGNMDPDQKIVVTYDVKVSDSQNEGGYPNVAVAFGTNRPTDSEDNSTSYSNFAFVYTAVGIGLSYVASIGGGFVLGASTGPIGSVLGAATGSPTMVLIMAILMILAGLAILLKKGRKFHV